MNMKKLFGIIVLAMLAVCSTALVSCGDDEENIAPQEQENNDDNTNNPDDPKDQDTPAVKDVIVEVDEEGKANDGHRFTKIDATNFYIDDIKYTASQGNLIVTGYDQAYFNGEANIITTLKYDGRTMNVTEISADAFKNCTVLTSIAIPNSVTKIGYNAFTGCTGLTKAEFASVESLCKISFGDYYANPLYYAHHLYINGEEIKDLVIPNSVTNIGDYAFYGCSSLTSVTIPNSVTTIGYDAFYGCTGLTSITIPNSVTNIGDYAFYGCSSLTSVTIPNSVTEIGWRAFSGCSSLTSINIPNSVTSIGEGVFSGCSGLTDIYCYATTPPSTIYYYNYQQYILNPFDNINISSITLHVPAQSVDTYKSTSPWSGFGSIVVIE